MARYTHGDHYGRHHGRHDGADTAATQVTVSDGHPAEVALAIPTRNTDVLVDCDREIPNSLATVAGAKSWKAACKAAGCLGRIPHDVRRSPVRTSSAAGSGEHTAMKLSGHKTSSVFRRYDIVSPDDLREAARKLDRQNGLPAKAR